MLTCILTGLRPRRTLTSTSSLVCLHGQIVECRSAPKTDFPLGSVDIEEQEALAAQYKIRNLPTVIAFRNGKEVDKFSEWRAKLSFILDPR